MEVPIEFKFFLYFVVVFSAVFHEYFHGWAAFYLGDPTAKYAGRLTLNPLKHLDPMGTVIIPLFLLFFVGVEDYLYRRLVFLRECGFQSFHSVL